MMWTRKIKFSVIAEYYGLINTDNGAGRSVTTWNGVTGPKHTDCGFRLRSKIYRTPSSFAEIDLKESIEKVACPLDQDDRGVYQILITLSDGSRWDYIGEAGGQSIYVRLLQHFIKMTGLTEHSHTQDAEGYKNFRQYVADNKIEFDITRDVSIRFVVVPNTKNVRNRVHKIEGRAIERYFNKHGNIPNLNTRDELYGMDGF
jgi:hypothetical protein